MKIQLNDYVIEIKAKDEIINKKYNKHDTLNFLNWLSIAFNAAANHEDTISCHAIAKDMRDGAHALFVICQENGLYNSNKERTTK